MIHTINPKNKAKALAALYNSAKPVGLGIMHYDIKPMDENGAKYLLDSGLDNFDYLHGRVMKVSLASCDIDLHCYNRDNGEGVGEQALAGL